MTNRSTSSNPPVILVTGAGGFIGSAVARALVGAGHAVRAGVRSTRPANAGSVLCDLDRPDQVADAVRGADLVIHAAYGAVDRMETQCRTMLEAMATAGVGRIIYLSSVAVYGDATGDIDEDFAGTGQCDAYGLAKRACEAAISAWAAQDGRAAIILRPGIVYGAGSPLWIDKMVERIRAGALGRLGETGEGIAALIHRDDLVAMTLAAAARLLGQPPQGALILNAIGPETPSWNAYFTALGDRLGLPLREMGPGEQRLRQVVAVAAKVWRRLGLPGGHAASLFPMPGECALFARKARYSSARASGLGVTPQIGLSEGLARSLPQPSR